MFRLAVAKANAVSQAKPHDTGLIKGIFVAPEYSFAAELAGISDPPAVTPELDRLVSARTCRRSTGSKL